jgi:hypothetical protein
LLIVKTFGLDNIVVAPSFCSAVSSNFNTVAPTDLNIPRPLVAPATGKLKIFQREILLNYLYNFSF